MISRGQVFDTEGTFSMDAGKCLATLAHLGFQGKGDVSVLVFSADGQHLYSGASDGTVVAWKISVSLQGPQKSSIRYGFL